MDTLDKIKNILQDHALNIECYDDDEIIVLDNGVKTAQSCFEILNVVNINDIDLDIMEGQLEQDDSIMNSSFEFGWIDKQGKITSMELDVIWKPTNMLDDKFDWKKEGF